MSAPGSAQNKPRLPGQEKKIFGLPESTVKAIATGVLVIGAAVGILKYTGRDRDVESSARNAKNKADKKISDWTK